MFSSYVTKSKSPSIAALNPKDLKVSAANSQIIKSEMDNEKKQDRATKINK